MTRMTKLIALVLFFGAWLFSCGVVEKLANRPPVIKNIVADPDTVSVGGVVFLTVEAVDPENDEMTFTWSAQKGHFVQSKGAEAQWVAPEIEGVYELEITVQDVNGGKAEEKISVTVISETRPVVHITYPRDGQILVGLGKIEITVDVSPLTFIEQVDFYLDDELLGTDRHPPYSWELDLTGLSGPKVIRCEATRIGGGGMKGMDIVEINVQGVVSIPL